jgi:hypothetical protein
MRRRVAQKRRRARLLRGLLYKALNIKDNRPLSRRHSNAEAASICVFFAQHIAEIVRLDL